MHDKHSIHPLTEKKNICTQTAASLRRYRVARYEARIREGTLVERKNEKGEKAPIGPTHDVAVSSIAGKLASARA